MFRVHLLLARWEADYRTFNRIVFAVIAPILILTIGIFSYYKLQVSMLPVFPSLLFGCLLILLVGYDAHCCISSVYHSASNQSLALIRYIIPEIDASIHEAKSDTSLSQEQILKLFSSDFKAQPIQKKILKFVLTRVLLSFIITIIAFSMISLNLAASSATAAQVRTLKAEPGANADRPAVSLSDAFPSEDTYTYKHPCIKNGGFFKILLHFSYYHTVIFQGLGDSDHSPETATAELVAILESGVVLIYIYFFLQGIINVYTLTFDRLKPEVLIDQLRRELTTGKPVVSPV